MIAHEWDQGWYRGRPVRWREHTAILTGQTQWGGNVSRRYEDDLSVGIEFTPPVPGLPRRTSVPATQLYVEARRWEVRCAHGDMRYDPLRNWFTCPQAVCRTLTEETLEHSQPVPPGVPDVVPIVPALPEAPGLDFPPADWIPVEHGEGPEGSYYE